MNDLPEIAAVFIALVSLAVSVWQIRWSQHESTLKSTFQQLKAVIDQLQLATRYDPEAAAEEYVAFYTGGLRELTDGAKEFAALLTELDLLCLGIAQGTVKADVAKDYLGSLLAARTIHFREVIDRLRGCCGDPRIFRHLYSMLPEFGLPLDPAPRAVPGASGAEAATSGRAPEDRAGSSSSTEASSPAVV